MRPFDKTGSLYHCNEFLCFFMLFVHMQKISFHINSDRKFSDKNDEMSKIIMLIYKCI